MTPIFRSRQNTPPATGGFTLLELLLVLGIIALAAALVVPNLGGLEARSFTAQLRDLGAQLNYARRNAVVSGQTATILVSSAEAGCNETPEQPLLQHCLTAEGISLAFDADAATADSRSQRNYYEPTDSVSVRFYPEGGSSGGRLELTLGDTQAWIGIDSFTGRVQVSNEDTP